MTNQTETGDLSSWMGTPHTIAVDAKGYVWRAYRDEEFWSMAPVNPDNSPIPSPLTHYVPVEGVPARAPHPVSRAGQGYNDPGPDARFFKVNDEINCCWECGRLVFNNTESRDGHACSEES